VVESKRDLLCSDDMYSVFLRNEMVSLEDAGFPNIDSGRNSGLSCGCGWGGLSRLRMTTRGIRTGIG